MIAIGFPLFVQLPSESAARVLHAFEVSGTTLSGVTIRGAEGSLGLAPGQDIRVYFELKQKFMQQAARVEAVLQNDDPKEPADALSQTVTLSVQLLGQPVSAESRECYRVSTVTAGLRGTLGGEASCVLADVSIIGMSMIARERHEMGEILSVSLEFEGRTYRGSASVQSIKDLGKGQFRYGLNAIEDKKGGKELQGALHKISMSVQRAQLKRLAGAA